MHCSNVIVTTNFTYTITVSINLQRPVSRTQNSAAIKPGVVNYPYLINL